MSRSARAALRIALLVAAATGLVVPGSDAARTAAPGPGLGQLAGAEACYAQAQDDSDATGRCRVAKGLIDAASVVVSPDGTSVYTAAWGSDAVGVFRRTAGGGVVEVACVSNNGTTGIDGTARQCTDGDALSGATALAVSPDGRSVYVAAWGSSGIAEFARDPGTGRLRQVGCVRGVKTCTAARGLAGASAIVVSPDGANVYLAASFADAVTSFARDPETGVLKGIGCVSDDGSDRMCAKGNALRWPDAVVISADGRSVYVAAADSSSVLTFSRDPATGALTQTGCALENAPKPGSCTAAHGLESPAALALAPDGRTLFVASSGSNAVAVFARNRATGALSERGCVSDPYDEKEKDGCVHLSPLQGPTGITVAPDGLRLYVATESGLTVFSRDAKSGGLRLDGCLTYRGNDDPSVRKRCALADGIAGATGVAVSPDGGNVYVTAAASDALAAFAPAVATRVTADLPRRRLLVSLSCPAASATPCAGRVAVVPGGVSTRPYDLQPGAGRNLAVPLTARTVQRARLRPLELLVRVSERDRSPVVRAIEFGSRATAPQRPSGPLRGDPVRVVRQEFRQTFCGPGGHPGWCADVLALRISRTTLVGATHLKPGGRARAEAAHICAALSTLAYAGDPRLRLASVRVTGIGNRTLSFRARVGSRCTG